MGLVPASLSIFNQLRSLLEQLSEKDYSKALIVLDGSSIGKHSRHILEFYECIISDKGKMINYDHRKRDLSIETSLSAVKKMLAQLESELGSVNDDRDVCVETIVGGKLVTVNSSLYRELLYAMEHAIHHMAILKIAVRMSFEKVVLPDQFGVAESTRIHQQNT